VKGTPLYIAPELQFESQGNSKIDVYSFGIVVFRLAFNGTHPYHSASQMFCTIDEYF
jgi:serine/threonine protein kinase